MKDIYQEEGGFQKIDTEYGCITTVVAKDESSHDMLSDQICMTIDEFSDVFIERLEELLKTKYKSVGLLVKIEVYDAFRGQGKGNDLMADFKKDVSDNTEVDILFARVRNEQKAGFNLQDFYKSHGFEPVYVSDGTLLMINKGQAQKILEAIIPQKVIDANEQAFSF